VALCGCCGEEIALANDIDHAGDIDRRRHRVMVAGKPRSLTPSGTLRGPGPEHDGLYEAEGRAWALSKASGEIAAAVLTP
jgi:hypothetical protein